MSSAPIRLIERKSGRELLEKHCREQGIPLQVFLKLVALEHDNAGVARRHNLFTEIDDILDQVPPLTDHAPLKD